jgi:hypothetical protein
MFEPKSYVNALLGVEENGWFLERYSQMSYMWERFYV